jgi:hypothetical protein
VCMKHLSIPEGSDKRDIWDRVIVPSIRDKYQSTEHEVQYEQQKQEHLPKHEILIRICKHVLHVLTPFVLMIYTFTDDNKVVEPDPLSEGFARFAESNMEHYVFEFLLNYVLRMKSDLDWRKLLKKNPEKPFLLFVTPSDIAFTLSLIKNGRGVWNQAIRQQNNPTQIERKAQPLFTTGEGKKKESGRTVWNDEGLNFYYTAEKNWKKVYNDKEELSDLCNKRERWEPENKGRKNPVRTYWRRNDREKDDIEEEEEVKWWEEQNVGYNDKSEDEHDITWDDDLKKGAGDDDYNDGDKRRE